jgi:NAD(P)-dependent dehydrogenase (short-subunit alcohol dehydrogenase family)
MATTWFITGAAGGFGNIWARAALERGDDIVATSRDVARLDDLHAVADRHGGRVLTLELDVVDRAAVFASVDRAVDRFGRLDVVVNNAGYGHFGMVEELTEAQLRAQLETNFFGATWVTQAAVRVLREQGAGHLLQVTSEGGVRAYPGIGAYHASKWALEGLSESLAQELEPFGVHVTCVEPGPYATEWLSTGSRRSDPLPAYAAAHAAPTSFDVGDPEATSAALFRLVDHDDPPRRLVLGRTLPEIEAVYQERLETWRAWREVSEAAFGVREEVGA